jgi:hypothetical protein
MEEHLYRAALSQSLPEQSTAWFSNSVVCGSRSSSRMHVYIWEEIERMVGLRAAADYVNARVRYKVCHVRCIHNVHAVPLNTHEYFEAQLLCKIAVARRGWLPHA